MIYFIFNLTFFMLVVPPFKKNVYRNLISSIILIVNLLELKHENVVSLIEVVVNKSLDFYLVFEYAQNDLSIILDNTTNPFTESEIKCLMQQWLKVYTHIYISLFNFINCKIEFIYLFICLLVIIFFVSMTISLWSTTFLFTTVLDEFPNNSMFVR